MDAVIRRATAQASSGTNPKGKPAHSAGAEWDDHDSVLGTRITICVPLAMAVPTVGQVLSTAPHTGGASGTQTVQSESERQTTDSHLVLVPIRSSTLLWSRIW